MAAGRAGASAWHGAHAGESRHRAISVAYATGVRWRLWVDEAPRRGTQTRPEPMRPRAASSAAIGDCAGAHPPDDACARAPQRRRVPAISRFLPAARISCSISLMLLAGFLLLFEVFTFFDLLDDIAQHRTGAHRRRELLSVSVLLPVLPARAAGLPGRGAGDARRHDQEQRTGGVQGRRRQPVPHCAAAAGGRDSVCRRTFRARRHLSALRQPAAGRAAQPIKGRPAQTYYQPQQQWIFGDHSKIYNYQLFDPDQQLFGGLNVFELDPATFALRRRIYAERAHWEPQQTDLDPGIRLDARFRRMAG